MFLISKYWMYKIIDTHILEAKQLVENILNQKSKCLLLQIKTQSSETLI